MKPHLEILPKAQLKLWPKLSTVPKEFILYGGPTFDPSTSLRALCSYRDGDLPELDKKIQQRLIKAASAVKTIPVVDAICTTI